jgi:hypothetical protein
LATNDSKSDGQLQLDYPVSRYRGIPLFVGINFFGTRFIGEGVKGTISQNACSQDDPHVHGQNNSLVGGHRLLFVRTIILWYFNRADTIGSRQRLRQSTLRLFEEAQNGGQLRHVNFKIFGDEIANR